MLEKSSLPPVQCLFCNHLNPAGARFCNDCGSQLHLQPCDRCGASNKRAARNCYKCGAGFTLPGAPGLNAAPAILDNQLVEQVPQAVSLAKEPTPQPESVTPQGDDTVASRRWATAIRSRRSLRMAAAALLLVAIVMSGEYYSEQSAEFTKTQGVIPFAPSVSGTPISVGASVPTGTTPTPVVSTSDLDKALSLAPPGAGVASTLRPSPAPDAEILTRQDSPVFRECPDTVAALGLCNPARKTEGK